MIRVVSNAGGSFVGMRNDKHAISDSRRQWTPATTYLARTTRTQIEPGGSDVATLLGAFVIVHAIRTQTFQAKGVVRYLLACP